IVCRALAEIHSITYRTAGLLGPALDVAEPFVDFVSSLRDHAAAEIAASATSLPWDIGARVLDVLDSHSDALRSVAGPPVLLHGDFKVSNLHSMERDELLVLDWEFAYSGSALMDVGQLVRWSCPPPFESAFVDAYRRNGGRLPDDWHRWAALLG